MSESPSLGLYALIGICVLLVILWLSLLHLMHKSIADYEAGDHDHGA